MFVLKTATQQSVQPTCGSLRIFKYFSGLEFFLLPIEFHPTHTRLTQSVRLGDERCVTL